MGRYRRLGRLEDLEAAVLYGQKAVEIAAEGHPNLPGYLMSLASIQAARFERLGDLENLHIALKNCEKAVALTPTAHPELSRRLASLAGLYALRFHRLGDPTDLNIALEKQNEVKENLTSDEDPAIPLHNLATLFGDRYRMSGDIKDLQECLETYKAAVKVTHKDDPQLAGRHHNLAVAYGDRFERLADLQDLEDALENYRAALSLRHPGDPEIPKHLHGLAISFRDRFHRLQDIKDLDNGIEKEEQAVQLTPDGDPALAGRLENLAACLQDRYEVLGDLKDLDVSLKKFRQSLDLKPKDHPGLAEHLHSLGLAFAYRYHRLEDPDDLESSLKNLRKSVDMTSKKSPSLPARLKVLAETLVLQYEKLRSLGNTEILNCALELYQSAISQTPTNHPELPEYLQAFASTLKIRYQKCGDSKDLEAALVNYRSSFASQATKPILSWDAALEWAALAHENQLAECLTAYKCAFALLPEILWVGSTFPVYHYITQKTKISDATSDAISACIDYSKLTFAIEILEQGLATRFQQMFQLKSQEVIPEVYREQFEDLSSQLYSGTAEDLVRVFTERNTMLQKIRNCSGFENFLHPKLYEVISQACRNGPVIVLNSQTKHCDAIILLRPASDPLHIRLKEVTLNELELQKNNLQDLLQHCNVRTRDMDSSRLFGSQESFTSKPTEQRFEDTLNWLWTHIVRHIFIALESEGFPNGRIWWCLTGAFVGLPLHAAAPTDQFIHSYTSTLTALLDGNLFRPNLSPKVGIVGVTHSNKNRAAVLPGVQQEVKTITSIIGEPNLHNLVGEHATVKAVKDQLRHCSWIHLACHGKQDLYDPPKSHLQLYEGILDLETILQMSLSNPEFVYLAACQTAMGDSELINESFHLGGGFIAAGFRGAVGTLWSMRDADGPGVADTVYTHLFGNGRTPKVSDVARALQLAVRKMRDAGVPHERWVPFIHMGV
ncbi:CHAT domain-containing protein [Mycena latifolia]|nr:CHAT domain-containing protein [Mycena latifolia]